MPQHQAWVVKAADDFAAEVEDAGLIDGCTGSVMEPSGFFADNPEFQCRFNCRTAANPLLTTLPFWSCLMIGRPDDELF